jgi:hypothetical protein
MKLSHLKVGELFLSDSNVLFKVLPFTQSEARKKDLKDRIKALRIDENKIYYMTDMIVRKTTKPLVN